MDDVAAYKRAKGLPIEDLERERTVMADSLKNAARHALDPGTVRPFFERQITLAKLVPVHGFERWQRTSFD
jgi:chorismate mutase-like protein